MAVGAADAPMPVAGDPQLPQARSFPETLTPSMIIRTGNASIEVDSLPLGIARVRLLAARVGGFVANTSIQQGREQGQIGARSRSASPARASTTRSRDSSRSASSRR